MAAHGWDYGLQMNAITIGMLVTGCVFGAGLAGVLLHPGLPKPHLTRETQDVVKLGIGMLSVLSSLVLGLLIATAKGSSDSTDRNVRSYAADIICMAETLRDYGADATTPMDLLRRFTSPTLHDIWPEDGAAPDLADRRMGRRWSIYRGVQFGPCIWWIPDKAAAGPSAVAGDVAATPTLAAH